MKSTTGKSNRKIWRKVLSKWQSYVMLMPALIILILFSYYPIYGLLIAFKDYKASLGILGSPFADPPLKYFQQFFSTSIATDFLFLLFLRCFLIRFKIRRLERSYRLYPMRRIFCLQLLLSVSFQCCFLLTVL